MVAVGQQTFERARSTGPDHHHDHRRIPPVLHRPVRPPYQRRSGMVAAFHSPFLLLVLTRLLIGSCSGGAMLAWLAPPIILSQESMVFSLFASHRMRFFYFAFFRCLQHNVWGMIEWVLNTLIFLLAGLIIGFHCLQDLVALDWLYLFVFYAILMLIRFFIIFLFLPLIGRIGHKCTVKEAIFMSWAGLRGVFFSCDMFLPAQWLKGLL